MRPDFDLRLADNSEAESDSRDRALSAKDQDLYGSEGRVSDRASSSFGLAAAVIMLAGGAATGVCLVSDPLLAARPTDFELGAVAVSEADEAAQSLAPNTSTAVVEQAKRCETPMASIILRAKPGMSGPVRIRSGSYLSPNIHLGASPLRVALPFPTPYATGRGELMIESGLTGLEAFLQPVWTSDPTVRSVATVKVHWTPRKPC